MKIKQVVETPEGEFTFEGDISAAEHDFIMEAGINYLVKAGIVPFKLMNTPEEAASYVKPEAETQQ